MVFKLPLPAFKPLWRPVMAAAMAFMAMAQPAAAQVGDLTSAVGSAVFDITSADALNFYPPSTNQCVRGPVVMGVCPAGLVWTYRKPVAVVEITCKAGQSMLLGGPVVNKLTSAVTNAAVAAASGETQSCGSMGLDKQGNTKPRYYDVHVFRVTSAAYFTPQGVAAKTAMTLACPNLFKEEDWTAPVALAGAALTGINGLIPVYLSELDPLWKTAPPTPDSLLNTAVAGTLGAAGTGAQEGICTAAGLAAEVGLAPPSMLDQCIGSWSLRSPNSGWVTHKNESVAAMIVAARAYQRASLVHAVESEIVGKANIFSFVYPPIHPLAPIASGLRGSGCYNEGTPDPRWYSQNEVFLPVADPMAIMNSVVATKVMGVSKGFFVATYWRDTSCCTTPVASFPYAPFF